jgi:hypothetical protein
MTIEEAVDEVKVARTTTACAHSYLSRDMSVRPCGERGCLFVSHVKPFDLLTSPDDVS